jgi:ABC-type cobalamin transport system ATPase subunit
VDRRRGLRVVRLIYGLLPRLLQSGLTVLLVEQDVSQALGVASMVHCLLEGRITLEGRPGELAPAQIESAYFGATGARGKRNGHDLPPAATAPQQFFESPGAQS